MIYRSSKMITGVLTAEIMARWKGNNSKGSLISNAKRNSSKMITGVLIAEITVRLNGNSKWKGNNNLKENNSRISNARWKGSNRQNVSKENNSRTNKGNLINSGKWKGSSRCSKDNSSKWI